MYAYIVKKILWDFENFLYKYAHRVGVMKML